MNQSRRASRQSNGIMRRRKSTGPRSIAKEAIANLIEKASRICKQKCWPAVDALALDIYVKRWM
jgi:hypothetical protein